MDTVDPNRDGVVSLQEYMAFMISQETENVTNVDEVILAFKALTTGGDKTYISENELYAVRGKERERSTWTYLICPTNVANGARSKEDLLK